MNEPELDRGDEFYLRAFYDLNTCRSIGMSIGPIPWRDIVLYAQIFSLEEDLVEAFIQVIRQMDITYLDWSNKEEERNNKPRK